jgi:hypothetical protein
MYFSQEKQTLIHHLELAYEHLVRVYADDSEADMGEFLDRGARGVLCSLSKLIAKVYDNDNL